MRSQLRAYLLADPVVAAIVETRVSWGWREQGSAFPALTLFKTDGADDVVLEGVSGYVEGYVQADCWSDTSLQVVDQLAKAIRVALVGINIETTGGVIQAAHVLHEADSFEGEKPDRIFRVRLSLRVHYNS